MMDNKIMSGLRKLCRLYGRIKINGVLWLWDYVNDEPRKADEMTPEEKKASEKARMQEIMGKKKTD